MLRPGAACDCRRAQHPGRRRYLAAAFIPLFAFAPFPIPVAAIAVAVPSMVVTEVAARRAPVALEEPAAFPVRLDPISTCVRSTRPVAVMPDPAAPLGIPVTFDPLI